MTFSHAVSCWTKRKWSGQMDPGFEAVWTKPNPLTAFACAFPRLIWAMWATKYRWPEFGLFAVALEQITVFLERMRFLARNSCSQQKLKDAFASWHWSLSPSRHRHVCRGRPRYLPVPHRAGRQLDRCRPLHRSRRSWALPLIATSFGGLLKDCSWTSNHGMVKILLVSRPLIRPAPHSADALVTHFCSLLGGSFCP